MKYSATLFARPSFIEGFSRIMDLGGNLNQFNSSRSDGEADARAIQSDWMAIGEDLGGAMLDNILYHIQSESPGIDHVIIDLGDLSLEYSQGEVRVWRKRREPDGKCQHGEYVIAGEATRPRYPTREDCT